MDKKANITGTDIGQMLDELLKAEHYYGDIIISVWDSKIGHIQIAPTAKDKLELFRAVENIKKFSKEGTEGRPSASSG